MKSIIITSGEPAGIGPDLCLSLCQQQWDDKIVVCTDKEMLLERAKDLNIDVEIIDYQKDIHTSPAKAGQIYVAHIPTSTPVIAGKLDKNNSQYVLNTLEYGALACLNTEFDALVTAPVHKGVINDAGVSFSGHTEFFADISNTKQVVMMLATEGLRVSLVTTHLPLKDISAAITPDKLKSVIRILNTDLKQKFGIKQPKIYVCGLNPHAGEDGHLGREEIDIIIPCLNQLKQEEGIDLVGPLPADTIFNPNYLEQADSILAMYHDQGLPVLKYKGFGNAVNITLGLPFIRTSVDHGTALDLAGKGIADTGSFYTAITQAITMANAKHHKA